MDREIDVFRGSVIVNGTKLKVSNMFTAIILWMDDEKLIEGKNFLLKLGTKLLPVSIMEIKYKIDVNSGENLRVNKVYKNEIVECDIVTDSPIVYDKFDTQGHVERKTTTFYFVYPKPSIFVPDTEKCPSSWLIHLRYET